MQTVTLAIQTALAMNATLNFTLIRRQVSAQRKLLAMLPAAPIVKILTPPNALLAKLTLRLPVTDHPAPLHPAVLREDISMVPLANAQLAPFNPLILASHAHNRVNPALAALFVSLARQPMP